MTKQVLALAIVALGVGTASASTRPMGIYTAHARTISYHDRGPSVRVHQIQVHH